MRASRARLGRGEPGSLVGIEFDDPHERLDMIASDLQVSLPLVNRHTSAVIAARLLSRTQPAGLVVADDSGHPVAVLSSADLLGLLIPVDDADSEASWRDAGERTIGDLIDRGGMLGALPHVETDATLLELASSMIQAESEIATVDGSDRGPRFVTLPALLDAILAAAGDDGATA